MTASECHDAAQQGVAQTGLRPAAERQAVSLTSTWASWKRSRATPRIPCTGTAPRESRNGRLASQMRTSVSLWPLQTNGYLTMSAGEFIARGTLDELHTLVSLATTARWCSSRSFLEALACGMG